MRKRIISLVMAICMLCGLALNGITISASAADATTEIKNIEETIVIENGVPTGWVNYNGNSDKDTHRPTYTIEDDVAGGNGNVLKLSRESGSGGLNGKIYNFPAAQKVTVQYRVKNETATANDFILPSFVYNDATLSSPTVIGARNYTSNTGGGFFYTASTAFQNTQVLKRIAGSDWHTIKCVVDLTALPKPSIALFFDGTEINTDSLGYNLQSGLQINGILIGSRGSARGAVYLDDLTVTYTLPDDGADGSVTIQNRNMQLANTLNMAFIFDKDQRDDWTGCYALVTKGDGEPARYEIEEYNNTRNCIYFTGINANEMGVDISVCIYDAEDNQISDPNYSTTVYDYLNDYKEEYTDQLAIELANALIAYGEKAEAFFAAQNP